MSVPRLHRAQPTGRTLPILAATYSGCGRNTAPVSAVLANMSRRTDTVSSEGQGSKPTESGFVAISVPNTHWCALISCRLLVGESLIVVTARRPGTSVFWAVPHTQTRACSGLAHKASQLSESNGQSNTKTSLPGGFPCSLSTGPDVAPPESTSPFLNGSSILQDVPGGKHKHPCEPADCATVALPGDSTDMHDFGFEILCCPRQAPGPGRLCARS